MHGVVPETNPQLCVLRYAYDPYCRQYPTIRIIAYKPDIDDAWTLCLDTIRGYLLQLDLDEVSAEFVDPRLCEAWI